MLFLPTDVSSVDSQYLHLSPHATLAKQILAKVIPASRFLEHSYFHIKNTDSLIHIGASLPPLVSITYLSAEALRPPVVSHP